MINRIFLRMRADKLSLTALLRVWCLLLLGGAVVCFSFGKGWLRDLKASAAAQNVSSASTVSAASYAAVVAPEEIVAAFGSNLATTTRSAEDADPSQAGVQLPTLLGGASVEVNGRSAGMFFVSPGQINFLVPPGLEPGTGYVTIRSDRGAIVASGDIQIVPAAPAIFTANGFGNGAPAGIAIRVKPNGQQLYDPLAVFDPASGRIVPRPIDLGADGDRVFLAIFMTGARRVTNPNDTRILLGGSELRPAFIGPSPEFVGLEQVNFELPRTLSGRLTFVFAAIGYPTSLPCEIEVAPPSDAPPRVTALNNSSALAGERIEITGSGFSSIPAENAVLVVDKDRKEFNAQIEEASATRLKVIVPYGSGSGGLAVRTARGRVEYPFAMRTSVSGIVQAAQTQPDGSVKRSGVKNVTVRTVTPSGATISTTTSDDGSFLLPDVPPSAVTFLEIDGRTTGLNYPIQRVKINVAGARDNQFQGYIEIKQIGGVSVPTFNGEMPQQQVFSTPAAATPAENEVTGQTGQVTFEPNGSTATFPDGTRVNTLNVTVLETGRTPVDLPPRQFSSTIVQLTPFGARIAPGGKLTFPNTDGLAAGETATLYRFDQTPGSNTLGQFVSAGLAIVTPDGQRIETARDAIKESTYYFVSVPRPTTTIYGSVVEEDQTPARGALVQVRGQSIFALTDQNGAFILANVPIVGTNDLTLEVSYLRPDSTVDRTERSGVKPNLNALTFVSPPIVLPGKGRTRAPVILAPKTLTIQAGQNSEFGFIAYARVAGQSLRPVTVAGASFASVISNGNDRYTLRLTPAADAAGQSFTLTLTATDSQNLTTTETISLNVARSATGQSVTTDEDTPVAITLAGVGGNIYRIVTPPRFGALSGTAPNLIYTPMKDFNGADSFSFTVSNGTTESSPATVSIAVRPVNDPPRLEVGSTYTTNIGQQLNIVINGSDVDVGQKLTLIGTGLPPGATITQTTATSWLLSWTPKFDQLGSYTVNLTLRDDGLPLLSDSRAITIVVDAKWAKTSGPDGASVRSLAVLGNIVFAGTFGGDVFRLTGNDVIWTPVNAGLTNRGVYALAVSGTTLFAGTNGGGVFRSTDNGASWTAVNMGLTNQAVFALAVNGTTLFAGTSNSGVFRSTDNGASWTAANMGLPNQPVLALAVSGTTLFAGTSGGGVFRSTDNGASWTPVNTGLTNRGVNALAVSGTTLFAGTSGGGVFRSTDIGASWTAVNNGLGNLAVLALTVKETALFAGTEGGVYRTTDSGANWTVVNNGLRNLVVRAFTIKENALFAGTDAGVYLLAESATTWTESNNGLANRNVNAAILNGDSFLVGTYDGGVFRSADKGQSWSPANTGLPPAANVRAFTPSGNDVLTGLAGAGVYFSNDQGRSWTARNSGLTNQQINALTGNGSTVYAGTNGGVFRSGDGGANWTAVNTGLTRLQVLSLSLSGGAVYAGTDNGLFRSANQGASWTPVNTGLSDLYIVSLGVAPDGTTLLAGTSSGLFRSSNAGGNQGQSWTPVTNGVPERVVALTFVQKGTKLLAGTVNGFFVSEDNGASWRQINGGLLTLQVGALAVSGDTVLAGTRSGGVFVSQLP